MSLKEIVEILSDAVPGFHEASCNHPEQACDCLMEPQVSLMAPVVERLLADERNSVLGELLAFNSGLGCTPQEGYKDLTDALQDTEHLVASAQRVEREKVRKMCAEYLEKEAAKCADFADKEAGEARTAWNREESWYEDSAAAIRQLDLTAPSSMEEEKNDG